MKKILLMALVAMTIFSCSKEEENVPSLDGKASLTVKIDMSKFTRSGDGIVSDPIPGISQMLLVVEDKDGTQVTEKVVTNNFTSPIKLIEKTADANLIGGMVYVYAVTTGNDWTSPGVELSTSNLPTLAANQSDINLWQKDQTATKGGFVNVPYYGAAKIVQNGINADSHILLTANVTITPELGRVQVLGTPQGGDKVVGSSTVTVSDIVVTNVYINNVLSNGALVSPRGNNSNDWVNGFFNTGGTLFSMQDAGSGFGYQVFDGNTPHVIAKITYKTSVDGGATADHTGFITIQKFAYDGETNKDLTVLKGKIYNVNLGALTITYDKIGDEPYDNTVYYDLVANVAVLPWSIINVTPELP